MNTSTCNPTPKQRPRRPLTLKFDDLPDDALIPISVVMDVTGRRTTSIYSDIKQHKFPSPERWGSRCSRWRVGLIRRWLVSPASYMESI